MIEFIIPSYNRPFELDRCIASIPKDCIITPIIGEQPRSLPAIINDAMLNVKGDIIVLLNDHNVVQKGFADEIYHLFDEHFPDLFGVVGLHHINCKIIKSITEFCNVAIGKNILNHFPNKAIFCPEYYHYVSDTEFGLWARDVAECYIFGEDARLMQHTPHSGTGKKDSTWWSSRQGFGPDHDLKKRRFEKGLLWGKTFEILTKPYEDTFLTKMPESERAKITCLNQNS